MWFVFIPLNILLECSNGVLQVDPPYACDVNFKTSLLPTTNRFLFVHGLHVGWMMLRSFLQENIFFGLLHCDGYILCWIFHFLHFLRQQDHL
jgi:hypothetical protein